MYSDTNLSNTTIEGTSDNDHIENEGNYITINGNDGDDTLFGGADDDQFWFGKGNGSDIINDCDDDDLVVLYDISLSDIMSFAHEGNQISASFSDGSRLTVNTSGDESHYRLGDGSKWEYNHNSRVFEYDD